MRFSLILYGFYLLLRYTAWKYTAFETHLSGTGFTMTIQTADGKRARRYLSRGGTLTSGRGFLPVTDFALVWKDPAAGYRCMKQMKMKALMGAISDGSLTLRGDAEKVTVFLDTYRKLISCYRKPRGTQPG